MRQVTVFITLILIVSTLAGCAPGSGASAAAEPTMTAIPLPTFTPTVVAARVEPSSPTPLPSTAAPLPTATATPEATATPGQLAASPSPTPTPEPTATARPKTARPKPTAAPELGGRLVFQTTLGGDFYVVNADGTNLRRITDGVDPVWSPNGQQIAFTRWREPRGVWLVDVNTGAERRIFDWDEARWPTWSPDGRQILFSRQHGGREEETEKCFRPPPGFGGGEHCFTVPPSPHWKLAIVAPGDGAFHEPLSADVSQAPDWSPGGAQIVYDGEHGLVVQSVDGSTSYPLTGDAQDTGPAWSPDGSRVAFTRRQHDHWEIYVVDADGGNLVRLTQTPQRPDGQPGSSAAPAWSPDGRHLAFLTDRSGKWEIWVMAADGSDQRSLFGTQLAGLALEYGSLGERALSWTR